VIISNTGTGCDQVISGVAAVLIVSEAIVSISASNPVVCIGGSSVISSIVTNGSGVYTYQWQQSPAGLGTWSNITINGNSATYNVPTGAPGSLDYRLIVVDVQYGCGSPLSNVVNVTVQSQPDVDITVDNNVVCIGGSAVISSTITNGSGSYVYQWQSSPDGSSGWVDITTGGTGANYNVPTSTPNTTYYRVMVSDVSNGCADPVSDALSVTIEDQPSVSISVDNNEICINGTFIISSFITNGSGLYNYQWQSSPNGSTGWTDITINGTSANYSNSPSTREQHITGYWLWIWPMDVMIRCQRQ
jgi:hypothetical protein